MGVECLPISAYLPGVLHRSDATCLGDALPVLLKLPTPLTPDRTPDCRARKVPAAEKCIIHELTLDERRVIMQRIVDDLETAVKASRSQSDLLARDTSPSLLPLLSDTSPDRDFRVKEWSLRTRKAEVDAIREVLEEFQRDVQHACREGRQSSSGKVMRRGYIMCRVDSGSHCFGLFMERHLELPEGKTQLLVFDPSHMERFGSIASLFAGSPDLNAFYEAFVMCPLSHFRPDSTAVTSHYWGITAGKDMIQGTKVINQVTLHKGNECGVLTYFVIGYFLTLGYQNSLPVLNWGVGAVPFTYVDNSMWDDRHEWPAFGCETIPAHCLDVVSDGGSRFVRRKLADVQALAFLEEFDVFAEYSPLGMIHFDGVRDIQYRKRTWIQALEDAHLLPEVGDGDFREHCYLKLILPLAASNEQDVRASPN
eukprot:TRINITY_DN7054_c0_g1_i2.p1 TRINITY_DN7054_c0_g1~~TRINITY_DN7054_c0_g1_i2.p1  ORF type:complete len:424 (-),score=48.44 TRINITY_DN7054_c0_g1_i2:251-1522(-)